MQVDDDAPGSRRFRDLLAREREDVATMARSIAELYDDITGGRASKPMTDPKVIARLVYERIDREVDEAEPDVDRMTCALKALAGRGPDDDSRIDCGEFGNLMRPSEIALEVVMAYVEAIGGR